MCQFRNRNFFVCVSVCWVFLIELRCSNKVRAFTQTFFVLIMFGWEKNKTTTTKCTISSRRFYMFFFLIELFIFTSSIWHAYTHNAGFFSSECCYFGWHFFVLIVIRYVFFVFFVLLHRFWRTMALSSVEVGHFPALHNKNHTRLISKNLLNSKNWTNKNVPLIEHVCVRCVLYVFVLLQFSWMWVVICSILLITLKWTEVKATRTHCTHVESEVYSQTHKRIACGHKCDKFVFSFKPLQNNIQRLNWARKRTSQSDKCEINNGMNAKASNTSKSHLYFGLSYTRFLTLSLYYSILYFCFYFFLFCFVSIHFIIL